MIPGTREDLIDRGQLLLLLGGLLLGRLLLGGLLGLFLRSHVQLLYRLFGLRRLKAAPQNTKNMKDLHSEIKLCLDI